MKPQAAFASLVVVALTAGLALAQDEQKRRRPEAPEGFAWHKLEGIDGSVLVPDGWHFSKASQEGTVAYRVTKEDVKQGKHFLTGLTINVVGDVQKKFNLPPSKYAVYYIDKYMKGTEVVVKPKVDQAGLFQRIRCEVEKTMPAVDEEKRFHLRVVTFANDKTGTLYVLNFGAPADEWEEAWKTGKTLFNPIILDSDV